MVDTTTTASGVAVIIKVVSSSILKLLHISTPGLPVIRITGRQNGSTGAIAAATATALRNPYWTPDQHYFLGQQEQFVAHSLH